MFMILKMMNIGKRGSIIHARSAQALRLIKQNREVAIDAILDRSA
jgi:hypothetical protein